MFSLEHPYHSFFTQDTNGQIITVDPTFFSEAYGTQAGAISDAEVYKLSRKWIEIRIADINFVLDSFAEAKNAGRLSEAWFVYGDETIEHIESIINTVDGDKIGVMGHSMGGAASVGVGRERNDIDAVIDLDGTMLSEQLSYDAATGYYTYNSEPYPTPVLTIDNEEHHAECERAGELYVNSYIIDNAVDGRSTYFIGSAHMNFTDLPLFSPALAGILGTGSIDSERCIREMNKIALEYMNYYLKDEGELSIREYYE